MRMTKSRADELCEAFEEDFRGAGRLSGTKAVGEVCLGCRVERELSKKPKERNVVLLARAGKVHDRWRAKLKKAAA